jgi:hypothetical protein
MTIKDDNLWIEGQKEAKPITMSLVVMDGAMCRISDSDHIAKVLFL